MQRESRMRLVVSILCALSLTFSVHCQLQTKKDVSGKICPDEMSECPDSDTCCELPDGTYSCCPTPEAVCCADGKHCCPNGQKCDEPNSTCKPGNTTIILLSRRRPTIICPDGRNQCPNNNTCCKVSTYAYGCCTIPDAVCCMDGKHCCPKDSVCDLSNGTCVDIPPARDLRVPLLQTKRPIYSQKESTVQLTKQNLPPPHRHHHVDVCQHNDCAYDQTCCKQGAGADTYYLCCPTPNGVCCGHDSTYCCPQYHTCNIYKGTCDKVMDMNMLRLSRSVKTLPQHYEMYQKGSSLVRNKGQEKHLH